jgi:arylsulfatase A-like enzyme
VLTPNAARTSAIFDAYAQKARPAWLAPRGSDAPLVTTVALEAAVAGAAFEQRDALVAIGETTLAFRVVVPRGGRFTFAEGTLGAPRDATVFAITAVDALGETRELYRHALAPSAAGRWVDAACELDAYAGQTIEVRLSTSSAPRSPAPSATTPIAARAVGGVALWGSPTILARTTSRVPYNVLWIDLGGLRPDARSAGLTPAVDALAAQGVRFTHAYASATTPRDGTLAMLAGARVSEFGLASSKAALSPGELARFYASDPPLLPLTLRRHGVATHAFVDDALLGVDAQGRVDLGFDQTLAPRGRPSDTRSLTRDAAAWITHNEGTRFFLFVAYAAQLAPTDDAPKRDAAVGALMKTLADGGLRERTIVVLTASAGATGTYEERTRVPMLVVAPGLLPAGRDVEARVRTTDLAPTLGELLGLEPHARTSGRSLVALARGGEERDERVVVSEGPSTRAILHGRHRLIERAATTGVELYDVVDDPGERTNLAPSRPELVAEMRARLRAALDNTPVAGSAAAVAPASDASPIVRVRFAGGASARRVSGSLVIGDATTKARRFTVEPVELGRDALKIDGARIDIALTTSSSVLVGLDIVVDPPTTPISWDLYLDDEPWPAGAVFGGPYGLLAPALRGGVTSDEARRAAGAALMPTIDPGRDVGVFVTRARREAGAGVGRGAK